MSRPLPFLCLLMLAASPALAASTVSTTVNPQAAAFASCMQGGGSLSDCQTSVSRPQGNAQVAPGGSDSGMLSTGAQPQSIIRAPTAADTGAGTAASTASPWDGYSSSSGGAVPDATSDAVANPVVNRNDTMPPAPNYPEGAAPYDSPEAAATGAATTPVGPDGQTLATASEGAAAANDPFAAMRNTSSLAGMFPMNQQKAAPRPPVNLHGGGNSCADIRRGATGLGVYHIEQANRYSGPAIWVDGRFRRLSVPNQILYLADLDCALVARNYGQPTQWTLMEQGSRRTLGMIAGGMVSWQ